MAVLSLEASKPAQTYCQHGWQQCSMVPLMCPCCNAGFLFFRVLAAQLQCWRSLHTPCTFSGPWGDS